MRLKAYILAADPAWIEESVLSYYDIVDEIVVSYDEDRLGYTGVHVAVEECLNRLSAIDRDEKIRLRPGHYARLTFTPMENETYQRMCALSEASDDADWVLQVDTDEVLADTAMFMSCLIEAESRGFEAMHYPARWLFTHLGGKRYLESCSRFWGITAGFPGAVAVRAKTKLRVARHVDAKLFRVDFRLKNTDPYHPKDAIVHRSINSNQGIYHFSWVRTKAQIQEKTQSWSHSRDRNWTPILKYWEWCSQHPYLAALYTPFRIRSTKAVNVPARFRISRINGLSAKQFNNY